MRLSTILPTLGVTIATLAVFALITTWAVSESTVIDSSLWYIPGGFLVLGVILMAIGRRLGH